MKTLFSWFITEKQRQRVFQFLKSFDFVEKEKKIVFIYNFFFIANLFKEKKNSLVNRTTTRRRLINRIRKNSNTLFLDD